MEINPKYHTRARALKSLGIPEEQRKIILERTTGLFNIIRATTTDCLIESLIKRETNPKEAYTTIIELLEVKPDQTSFIFPSTPKLLNPNLPKILQL